MRRRPFLRSSANTTGATGVTLVEFMVAVGLSALVAGMIVSITLANRNLYQTDVNRTRVNQNLRSAIDIIGTEIRQAGERFPSSFPAILISNGASGATDELILRRNLLNEVFVVCGAHSAGVSYGQAVLSRASAATAACTYPNQRTNLTAWSAYATSVGNNPLAYIFNQTTRLGEFLTLANPVGADTGSLLRFDFTPKVFSNPYTAEFTSVYMMNQWRFRVSGGVLQIIENEDTANPQNIIDGITGFQVSALMQDGTTKTSFVETDSWGLIQTVRISITGTQQLPGRDSISRTLTGDFFPRNILSY